VSDSWFLWLNVWFGEQLYFWPFCENHYCWKLQLMTDTLFLPVTVHAHEMVHIPWTEQESFGILLKTQITWNLETASETMEAKKSDCWRPQQRLQLIQWGIRILAGLKIKCFERKKFCLRWNFVRTKYWNKPSGAQVWFDKALISLHCRTKQF
jgi:hypothetical protein